MGWHIVWDEPMKKAILCVVLSLVFVSLSEAQAPVFEINHPDSTVKFSVSASVPIAATFDQWDASVTFTPSDYATGFLDSKIQAASVNTGSAMKDGKLKSKDFFDVKNNPLITFHSAKVTRTSPTTMTAISRFGA
jgi:polyisoprenoid-binding protein YceI